MPSDRPLLTDVAAPPAAVLAGVADAAELWGALWRPTPGGGALELPVTAGVRRGVVRGRLEVEAAPAGSRLTLAVEESRYRVHAASVVVLLFGAAGGLAVLLWPYFPPLLRVAPLAAILALAAWFLVVARLRSGGPEEFLGVVRDMAENPRVDS